MTVLVRLVPRAEASWSGDSAQPTANSLVVEGAPFLLDCESHEGRHHGSHPPSREPERDSRTLCQEKLPRPAQDGVLGKACWQSWPWLEPGNLDDKPF